MPSFEIRERLVPYRILAYMLYANPEALEWLSSAGTDKVRVSTGDASRALRMRNAQLWDALYWLRDNQLILDVEKERKRGSAIITLLQPTNIKLKELLGE
jgi:hypothetical protein